MNEKFKSVQRGNVTRNWKRAVASLNGVLAFGALMVAQPVYAATTADQLQQAMTSTYAQPFVQLKATDVSSEQGIDNTGKPFHFGGKYTYDAQFKLDNGAYDELLTEQSKDEMGSFTNKLFITNKKALYMLQGKQWVASGTVPSTTLDEEVELLSSVVEAQVKQVKGHTEYVASLNGTEIATLFNNDFLQGQANTAFTKMANDLQTRTKDVLTVVTTEVHGKPVISQVALQLNVTLTKPESIAVWGATGNQSKLKPFHIHIQSVYNNTFQTTPFVSPLKGKTTSNSN